MKKRITAKALAKYIAKHPGDFEEVDTGYRSRNGEKDVYKRQVLDLRY